MLFKQKTKNDIQIDDEIPLFKGKEQVSSFITKKRKASLDVIDVEDVKEIKHKKQLFNKKSKKEPTKEYSDFFAKFDFGFYFEFETKKYFLKVSENNFDLNIEEPSKKELKSLKIIDLGSILKEQTFFLFKKQNSEEKLYLVYNSSKKVEIYFYEEDFKEKYPTQEIFENSLFFKKAKKLNLSLYSFLFLILANLFSVHALISEINQRNSFSFENKIVEPQIEVSPVFEKNNKLELQKYMDTAASLWTPNSKYKVFIEKSKMELTFNRDLANPLKSIPENCSVLEKDNDHEKIHCNF